MAKKPRQPHIFNCPHCQQLIDDKLINRYIAGRAGRVVTEARRKANRENVKTRWRRQKARDEAEKLKSDA